MALSVPLSRSTLRVGGGSAFYVRHHRAHHMNTLFPEKIERLPYLVRSLIYVAILSISSAILFPLWKHGGSLRWLVLIVVIPVGIFRFPFLDIPRLRSMGWSPWYALLCFVPLANCIMQILLFTVPERRVDA